METTQGLSSSQTSKNAMFFFLSHVFSSTKSENKRAQQVLLGGGGGLAQIAYTHVSKYKNDKIKFKTKKNN
jgi:hypothetical protein